MRLIDADELKKALGITSEDCSKCGWGSYESCGRGYDFEDACVAIDDAPTVDAVPVRYGRWEHHPEIGWSSTWLCSECGEKTVETVMGEPRYKFCPMCGADMMKDGDGNGLPL